MLQPGTPAANCRNSPGAVLRAALSIDGRIKAVQAGTVLSALLFKPFCWSSHFQVIPDILSVESIA